MGQIPQPHALLAALDQVHPQRLEEIRVEAAARAQLGQVLFQPVQGALDAGFELGEVKGVDDGFGVGGIAFVFLLAAFLEEMGRGGEGSAG